MRLVREMVDDRLMRSVQLWAAVAELPEYQQAATVMAFKGFGTEPDTDPLFARAAAEGKRLLVPRIDDGDIVVCDADGPMVRSRIGVEEPTGPALPIELIDFGPLVHARDLVAADDALGVQRQRDLVLAALEEQRP